MENELRNRRNKGNVNIRSMLDFVMGILYLGAAVFLFFAEFFGVTLDNFDIAYRYIFGGLCTIYGIWRIYRGLNKEQF